MKKIISTILLYCITTICYGLTFPLPKSGNIVGSIQYATIQKGESLGDIGRKFDIGVYEMIEANQNLDPWNPRVGARVLIPTQFILPEASKRNGIVINLAEMRLYYFHDDKRTVTTHPIGIGRKGWLTPLGSARIIEKEKNPIWRAPESIRKAALAKGKFIPKVVKAGPNNPLGDFALRLSLPGYLIHGTNRPGGIGVRSSSGCIRMFPEDIKSLFYKVSVGTSVRIIHEPFKIGTKNNQYYLEAHEPLSDPYYHPDEAETFLMKAIEKANLPSDVVARIKSSDIIRSQKGIPLLIN